MTNDMIAERHGFSGIDDLDVSADRERLSKIAAVCEQLCIQVAAQRKMVDTCREYTSRR